MLRRCPALILTLLVFGCSRTPSAIESPEPATMEPVVAGSLARNDGRIGPDPDAPAPVVTHVADPLEPFAGEPIEQIIDPDGLVIATHVLGEGPPAVAGDVVQLHYIATVQGGREFDSSHDREPFEVELGTARVIPGMERGLIGARVGSLRTLTIPPALGYGEQGVGNVVPAGATLVFYVEVLAIESTASLDP